MSDLGWVALGYLVGVVVFYCYFLSLFGRPTDIAVIASFHLAIRWPILVAERIDYQLEQRRVGHGDPPARR